MTRLNKIRLLFACLALPLFVSGVELVSVPDGSFVSPATGSGDSLLPILSANGRYVLFSSSANNLATTDNGLYGRFDPLKLDVFFRDRQAQTTTLVSADPANVSGGNGHSLPMAISTNGQFVLFESSAGNLAIGITNPSAIPQVFMRDVINQVTTLVSVSTNGGVANGVCSDSTMTPDGRYVAFSSLATNLVLGDTDAISDVFVRDMQLGVTKLVKSGTRVNENFLFLDVRKTSGSDTPVISLDGRFVAFLSLVPNAIPTINPNGEIYVGDLLNNTNILASTNAHAFISGPIECYNQKLSDDGQFVVFQATAVSSPTTGFILRHHIQTGTDDLVTSNASVPLDFYKDAEVLSMTPDGRFVAFIGKTNSGTGVFVWDAQTAAITAASVDANGVMPTNATYEAPRIDITGRFVSFLCTGTNLTATALVSGTHLYVRDLQNGIMKLVDAGTNGTASGRNFTGDYSESADGQFFAFDSTDSDIVTNDNNNSSDVFVRDTSTETTELISARLAALPSQTSGGGLGGEVSVSTDGRYVLFSALGGELVHNYTNRNRDVFLRDLIAQTNSLISVDTNGFGDAGGSEAVMSRDGRYVAFTSSASNLVSLGSNHGGDIFIRDRDSGTTSIVSTNPLSGGPLNGPSSQPAISADGRYVLFFNHGGVLLRDQSMGTNYLLATNKATDASMTSDGRYVAFFGSLTGGDTPAVHVWDSQLQQEIYTNSALSSTFGVSIGSNGQWVAYADPSNLHVADRTTSSNRTVSAGALNRHSGLRFSADSRFLVYSTSATNSLLDTNGTADVYVYDLQSDSNSLISRSFGSGYASNGISDSPDISPDGRYVVYASTAGDIVPTDHNQMKDVFLYDRQFSTTTLVSVSASGRQTANLTSQKPVFTGDGQTVAFNSWSSDIAGNDFNGGGDLFLLRINSTIGSGSTNPPPVISGQVIFNPGSGPGSGQIPQLTWAATPGTSYQVVYKDELTDPDWLPVKGPVVVEGGQGYAKDLASNPDHRFYRIVAY